MNQFTAMVFTSLARDKLPLLANVRCFVNTQRANRREAFAKKKNKDNQPQIYVQLCIAEKIELLNVITLGAIHQSY